MLRVCTFGMISLAIAGATSVTASAEPGSAHVLTPSDMRNHTTLFQQLSSDQVEALKRKYPGFRILKMCSGHFSGTDRDELVLGLWNPKVSEPALKREVHRVGLIWDRNRWVVHVIDDEIKKDENISRSFPMKWQYAFTESGFSGDLKCGIDEEFKGDSNLTYALGDKPFFDLNKEGLKKNKPVCFATSDTYNNWDCIVFSSKKGRFRLWFQQAHAD